ncbi:MAG: DNA-3-methyladenine glycosylase, partial [Nocardioidaceae bacterium]
MHWAVNLVCEADGIASAVLLRAGEVVAGKEQARVRRGTVPRRQLARGPGNLASALGATGEMTGATVWDGPLRWAPVDVPGDGSAPSTAHFEVGPRVGVSTAADVPWRFWLSGESRLPRAPAASALTLLFTEAHSPGSGDPVRFPLRGWQRQQHIGVDGSLFALEEQAWSRLDAGIVGQQVVGLLADEHPAHRGLSLEPGGEV